MPTLNFDASQVDPAVGFDPIPAGGYLCAIVNSEMKPTKSGSGSYLQLELEVLDGQYKGRRLWDRLNLENPSPEAVRIARGTLSQICRSVGVMAPRDSIELHNIPLLVKVGVKTRKDTGEPTNVVRGYARREAEAPTPNGVAGTPPPWKK